MTIIAVVLLHVFSKPYYCLNKLLIKKIKCVVFIRKKCIYFSEFNWELSKKLFSYIFVFFTMHIGCFLYLYKQSLTYNQLKIAKINSISDFRIRIEKLNILKIDNNVIAIPISENCSTKNPENQIFEFVIAFKGLRVY